MTSMILPAHVAEARAREKAAAVAGSIQGSTVSSLSSDDFVSRKQVAEQLKELGDYVAGRREYEAEYALPRPIGWRVSLLMLTIPEKTDGGLINVSETREAKAVASPQGVVLAIGPNAYKDKARFTLNGELTPWIEVGQRIVWKKYDVTMFQIANGQRIAFMNDTQAIGLIDDGWQVPV